MAHECIQFQIEIRKLAVVVHVLKTRKNLVISPTLLFCRGRQRNVPRIITHVHSHCSDKVAYYSFPEAFLADSSTHASTREVSSATRGKYHASVKRKPNKNNKHGARKKKFSLNFPCQYFQESRMFVKFVKSR